MSDNVYENIKLLELCNDYLKSHMEVASYIEKIERGIPVSSTDYREAEQKCIDSFIKFIMHKPEH